MWYHIIIEFTNLEVTKMNVKKYSVTMLDYAGNYHGDHVAIIAGDDYIYGDDPGEIVISDPVVIAILS